MLHDKYLLPKEEAELIASFLNPMLRLLPEKRAKASELIHHKWLEDVVVQGEVDVIRRVEEADARRKQRTAPAEGAPAKGKAAEANSDVDAMKPVDEAVSPVEAEDGAAHAHAPLAVPKLGMPVPSSSAAKENAHAKGVPTLHTVPHPPHSKGAEPKR